ILEQALLRTRVERTCRRSAVRIETRSPAEEFRARVHRMPRQPRIPTYRFHKSSGQAIVTLPDGLGNRRDVLLGPHGSAESPAEYARVLAEWEAAGACRRPARPRRTSRSTRCSWPTTASPKVTT